MVAVKDRSAGPVEYRAPRNTCLGCKFTANPLDADFRRVTHRLDATTDLRGGYERMATAPHSRAQLPEAPWSPAATTRSFEAELT
jgi:hypothetical protein